MKKTLAVTLLLSLLSTASMAGEFGRKHGEALGMSYVGVSVFLGVYATTGAVPGLVVGVSTAASVTKKELDSQKQAAAKLLIDDVQNYHQNGSLSVSLETSISMLQELNAELSDAEALDILQDAALSILE